MRYWLGPTSTDRPTVVGCNIGLAIQSGDGGGDFEDAVIGGGAQLQRSHGPPQELLDVIVQEGMLLDVK